MMTTMNPLTRSVQAGVQTVKSVFLDLYADECSRLAEMLPILRLARPNVLIVGPAPETGRTLERMRGYLRAPMASWSPRETANLPSWSFRTLVVRGVDGLNLAQQESLAALIERSNGDVQVVSIAGASLMPLVKSGAFHDRLYYQLNIVVLEPAGDRAPARRVVRGK